TQNHPGNAPNAPPTSSNTASATTPSRPPHHLPAEQNAGSSPITAAPRPASRPRRSAALRALASGVPARLCGRRGGLLIISRRPGAARRGPAAGRADGLLAADGRSAGGDLVAYGTRAEMGPGGHAGDGATPLAGGPVAGCRSRTVPSPSAVAGSVPSGLNATP